MKPIAVLGIALFTCSLARADSLEVRPYGQQGRIEFAGVHRGSVADELFELAQAAKLPPQHIEGIDVIETTFIKISKLSESEGTRAVVRLPSMHDVHGFAAYDAPSNMQVSFTGQSAQALFDMVKEAGLKVNVAHSEEGDVFWVQTTSKRVTCAHTALGHDIFCMLSTQTPQHDAWRDLF